MLDKEVVSNSFWLGLAKIAMHSVRHVTITVPEDNSILPVGPIVFQGRSRMRLGGEFVLCHRDGDAYWPHSRLQFHPSENSWKSEFTVPGDFPKEILDIVVVEVNEAMSNFINYYYENGRATGYKPIFMKDNVKGFTLMSQIRIAVRRA